jgi:uridine kinase
MTDTTSNMPSSLNKHTVIAIVGASASGKSLFAQTIFEELLPELGEHSISIVKEDAYYKDQSDIPLEQRILTNYDHPEAFEHSLLAQHLTDLCHGKAIETPIYCYKTHTRTTASKTLLATKIILVEGIMLLSNKELRKKFDIKVYMDTPLDICLIRRIKRDILERGRSLESVTEQYLKTVRPMYYEHIKPLKRFADIVVTRGGKNRMAIELIKAKIRQISAK